jgi:hypothetical protein
VCEKAQQCVEADPLVLAQTLAAYVCVCVDVDPLVLAETLAQYNSTLDGKLQGDVLHSHRQEAKAPIAVTSHQQVTPLQ